MLRTNVVLTLAAAGCAGVPPDHEPAERDPLASAQILSPGCAGSVHTTIQSAINAAVDGDVIEVCAGTYLERLKISGKDLTLRSLDGAAATTVDATFGGKALKVTGGAAVVVEGLTFVNGSTTGTGANVYCSLSTLELRDSVLANGAAAKGGGLGASDCTGIATGVTFDGNTATWSGGGAWVKGDLFGIEDNLFVGNEATSKGGGLYLSGDSAVVDNDFDLNHSKNGGAAYIYVGYGDLVGNTVTNNTCLADGAGIYVQDGAPLVLGNTFDANDADDEGGGLRVKEAESVIEGNVFTSNHADYRGGAIRVSHDEVTMTGNVYVGNSTWVTGGAVLLYESASLVSGEIYQDNTARNGGGLAIQAGWGDVVIEDTSFVGNTASSDGGHVWIDLDWTTTLRRVDLVGGTADRGGGVWATTSDLQIENTLFDGTDASVSGGALWLSASTGDVVNCVIDGSTAPVGAGLSVDGGVGTTLEVVNTVFTNTGTGAALALVSGLQPDVRYNDFHANTSDFSGMASVIGVSGNLAVDPLFVDPAASDYHLLPGSAVVDQGDPAISDPDGTRSDLGLHGGPSAD